MIARNIELDRLRAVAVLMTLYIHFSRVFYPWDMRLSYVRSDCFMNIWNNAWTGVDLFFVISGYIICKTSEPTLRRTLLSPASIATALKHFYIRRVFRIYPVAWFGIAFVLLASVSFNLGGYFLTLTNNAEAAVAIFAYTFNFYLSQGHYLGFALSHYWSLAIEEQFYLLFPLFLVLVPGYKHRVLALTAALVTITFIVRPLFGTAEILLDTHTRCDGLLYGALLGLVSNQPWFNALLPSRPHWMSTIFVWSAVLALAGLPGLGLGNSLVLPAAGLLSALLVAFASAQKSVVSAGTILNKVLDYIGSRSYALYVLHLPMFCLTKELMYRIAQANGLAVGPAWWPQYFGTAFALSFIVTELVYRCVERPMIAVGRRMTDAARKPAAAVLNALAA